MLDGNEIQIRESIGISVGTGQNDIESLIEMVDAAKYEERRNGKRIGSLQID